MRSFGMISVLVAASLLCSADLGGPSSPPATPQRTHTATVVADGEVIVLPTCAPSVADVLDDLQIVLGDLDYATPSPDTPIAADMAILVTRATCREVVEETPLAPDTLTLADPDGEPEFTRTLAQGSSGRLRRTWRVREEDGEIVGRSLVEETILRQPTDRIVLRGTRGLSDCDPEWREPLRMEATAYDPGPRSCGKWASGYTAIGLRAEKGVVAVDDRVIPMRTRLYIPGYGFAVAGDRGGAIKGMRIDLCYPTYEEAIRFGRRPAKVYVLD